MAHWIIEDHGFGGQIYRCSNCRESWNDLFNDCCGWDICENCGETIDEDATEYVEDTKKVNVEYIILKASKTAKITKQQLLSIFTENGLVGVYNLGLKHMYEYLENKNEKAI